jgi:hypothetical protein
MNVVVGAERGVKAGTFLAVNPLIETLRWLLVVYTP